MYTKIEIEDKIALARSAKLSGWRLLENRPRAMRVCNGIGAWWMSQRTRDRIGAIAPDLVIVADLHDLRHDTGGPWYKRWVYDAEFLCNGFRMAIYRQKRRVAWQALRLYLCLVAGSWTAFNYKRRG